MTTLTWIIVGGVAVTLLSAVGAVTLRLFHAA
jgi:hypothetical protein